MSAGSHRPERLKPYDRRAPSKLEMTFSFVVVSIVTLLGLLVLVGAFGIQSNFKLPLGAILVGYGLIRLWMLKSRFAQTGSLKPPSERMHPLEKISAGPPENNKEESLQKLAKNEEKNLRNYKEISEKL